MSEVRKVPQRTRPASRAEIPRQVKRRVHTNTVQFDDDRCKCYAVHAWL